MPTTPSTPETLLKQRVWAGRIPVVFSLDPHEVTTLHAPRHGTPYELSGVPNPRRRRVFPGCSTSFVRYSRWHLVRGQRGPAALAYAVRTNSRSALWSWS
uniref:Uncharacterized protein n=1 Tax=Hyaloperonospora arabidopsidis (strain Emoy2) TaxID=559515 RepID=M4BG66_HYAAE